MEKSWRGERDPRSSRCRFSTCAFRCSPHGVITNSRTEEGATEVFSSRAFLTLKILPLTEDDSSLFNQFWELKIKRNTATGIPRHRAASCTVDWPVPATLVASFQPRPPAFKFPNVTPSNVGNSQPDLQIIRLGDIQSCLNISDVLIYIFRTKHKISKKLVYVNTL